MRRLKTILFLFFTGLIITSSPSFSAKKKKTISKACLNCLNSFSATTLNFPKNIRGKCTKILTTCDKTDRTGDCEKVINECIEYNCSATGSCSNAKSNKALLFGCLSAENKFMPYQCRNYIKGKATSLAEQTKATAKQEELKKQAEIEAAKAEAEKTKAETERAAAAEQTKQTQIAKEAEIKQKQIEEENKIKLKEKEKELELKMAREQKKEKLNSNPNVKYNKALSNIRKAISQAKRESKSVLSQMGIKSITEGGPNDNKGNPTTDCEKYEKGYKEGKISFEFPPKCIRITVIDKNELEDKGIEHQAACSTPYCKRDDGTSSGKSAISQVAFVCTRDVKESFVRGKLDNIYKILTTANENLINEINEIENASFDETNTQLIAEEKFNVLHNIENNIAAALKQIQEHTIGLTSSCETRCNGFKGMDALSFKKRSSIVEYDEKGNIIEDKPDNNTGYSCPDYTENKKDNKQSSSPFDMMSLIGSTNQQADKSKLLGGSNWIAMDITERTSRAALEVDKTLEQINIIAMSNKIIGFGNFAGGGSYGNSNSKHCSPYDVDLFSVCMYDQFPETARQYHFSPNNFKKQVIEQIELINLAFKQTISECKDITIKEKQKIEKDKLDICISVALSKIKEKYEKYKKDHPNGNIDLELEKMKMELELRRELDKKRTWPSWPS